MCMARSDVGVVQLKSLLRFYEWLGWDDRVSIVRRLLDYWSRD